MPERAVVYGRSAENHAWIAARIDPDHRDLPERPDGRSVVVPVCQYNFFRLPEVVRFASARLGIAVPALPEPVSIRPLVGLPDRLDRHVAELERVLAGTRIDLEYPAHGLTELLALAARHGAGNDEPNLLRLLGVVCNGVFIGPKTFHLDVSNLCNTDCVFCGLHSPYLLPPDGRRGRRFVPGWERQQLDFEVFEKLIDDLAELSTVEDVLLSGEGEPLTHPRIADMIRAIKRRGMHLTLFTNGLLVKDRMLELILDEGVDVLYWSLSCASRETFHVLQPSRPPEAFDRMVERFSLLCDRKRADGRGPYVVLAHVINALNLADTASIAPLAVRVGVDAIRYQVMHSVPATERFLLSREQYDQVVPMVMRGRQVAARAGLDVVANIDFQLPQVGRTYDLAGALACEWSRDLYREIGCFTGWFFARNFTDGRVSFCCHDKIVGNLHETRFADLWRSERYGHIREVARDFDEARNVDLSDGVCGGWLLGPDCNVCGNYEFINQAQADLVRTGLIRFLHRPVAAHRPVEVLADAPEVHDRIAGEPGSFDRAIARASQTERGVALSIHRRNLLHLERDAAALLVRMGDGVPPLPSFSPTPATTIRDRFGPYVERLRQTLSGSRVRIGGFRDDVDALLSAIQAAARAEGEGTALRLLGMTTQEPVIGPRWFIFEIINSCNANCLYCNIHNPRRRPDPEWKRTRLSWADFRRTVDDLHEIGGEGMTLLANGEPLLHPDFPAMMRYGRERGLSVGFFTNGTLLSRELAEEAVRLGVAEINVTISAATPETYARLHHTLGPDDLTRTLANVRALVDFRNAARLAAPRLVMVNVVNAANAGELEAMVRAAAEAGFDEVRFQMVRLDDFNRDLALSEAQIRTLRERYSALERVARDAGVALWPSFRPQLFGVEETSGDWEADRYVAHGCFVGYHLGLMKADGDFSFCCVVKPLANVRDISLAELWRSGRYAEARRAAEDLARRGGLRLADGGTLLSDRCRRCDNHDVNRMAHEALTRWGLWPFVDAVPPADIHR